MTFAVMGRCRRTGQVGVALGTSFSVNVGRVSPRSRGVLPTYDAHGAIVMSHGFGNPQLPHTVFEMLDSGYSLARIKDELPRTDEFFSYRQLNVITVDGQIWVHTGADCPKTAEHFVGEGWAVSGNGLRSDGVLRAMAESMTNSADKDLADRLLRALEAAHDAGGMGAVFSRGQNPDANVPEVSGALFVVDGKLPYPKVDLRVEYHPTAVRHLRRLYEYAKPLDSYYEGLQLHPNDLDAFLEGRGVKRMAHFDVTRVHTLE